MQRVLFYLRSDAGALMDSMQRAVFGSVAQLAVVPAQDLLRLGSEARLNTPGTVAGNWQWRLPLDALNAPRAQEYSTLNRIFGRA
jgi:4-alpha-glucanotransferase